MSKKINQMSELTRKAIIRKSAQGLPDRPSASGMRTEDIKKAFYIAITDEKDSVFAELARIIDESNKAFEDNDQHIEDKDNPHNVTKEQIGLSNIDNTSDKDKPISSAQKEAFDALHEEVSKKANKTVKVNGKPLTDDVNLSSSDVGALSKDIKYVESINGKSGAITGIATETFVKEVGCGKTNIYAISIATNADFNSDEDIVKTSLPFTTVKNEVVELNSLKIGDTVYLIETNIPDRWFGGIHTESDGNSYAFFYKLETAKMAVCDVQIAGKSIVSNDIASIPVSSDVNNGVSKLYAELGQNTDGAMTQKATTNEFRKKLGYKDVIETSGTINPFANYYNKTETNNLISNPNLLINGDFRVNQRGQTSYTGNSTGVYSYDRWLLKNSCSLSKNEITGKARFKPTYQYVALYQYVEVDDPNTFSAKTLTLSLKISNYTLSNGIFLNLYITTESNSSWREVKGVKITSDFTTNTVTLPNEKITGLRVGLFETSSSPSEFDIDYVKLELGSIATAFNPRPYAEELVLCRRYCFPVYSNGQFYVARTDKEVRTTIQIDMRNTPTVIAVNALRAFQVNTDSTATSTQSTPNIGTFEKSKDGIILGLAYFSGLTQGGLVFGANTTPCIIAILDAEIY